MTEIGRMLEDLAAKGNLRELPHKEHYGQYIEDGKHRMLNLSSNDYLGLASDMAFYRGFLKESGYGGFVRGLCSGEVDFWKPDSHVPENFLFSSSSSRLLTGNFSIYDVMEDELARLYGAEAALFFGSGYHMNTCILPAIAGAGDLILADKLVHASIIDGMLLSRAKSVRYRHQDIDSLEDIVSRCHSDYRKIVIVTESIFSMDGDVSDLRRLVALKKSYLNVLLYVDEAHGVGVRGKKGLGVSEEYGCAADIDFLCGTMGKALASAGAFVICSEEIKTLLVNKGRPFIFTTALPPVNMLWSLYILRNLLGMVQRRERLDKISARLRDAIGRLGFGHVSGSHIIPLVVGDSRKAVQLAGYFQKNGFYLLPVRPPTVPEGTSRLRISLNAAITDTDVDRLISLTEDISRGVSY